MLPVNQQKFINARMEGKTIAQSAHIAGVSKMTGIRWSKLHTVQEALSVDIQTEALQTARETAHDTINKIYTTALEASCLAVQQIMMDAEAPAASRLKAAQMIQDRLAPPVEAMPAPLTTPGQEASSGKQIDWIIFTPEELAIILPIFEKAERRVVEAKKV